VRTHSFSPILHVIAQHLSYTALYTPYTPYSVQWGSALQTGQGECCIVLHLYLVRVTFPLIHFATTHVNGTGSETADFLSMDIGHYSNARGCSHTDRDIECEGKSCLLYPMHLQQSGITVLSVYMYFHVGNMHLLIYMICFSNPLCYIATVTTWVLHFVWVAHYLNIGYCVLLWVTTSYLQLLVSGQFLILIASHVAEPAERIPSQVLLSSRGDNLAQYGALRRVRLS